MYGAPRPPGRACPGVAAVRLASGRFVFTLLKDAAGYL